MANIITHRAQPLNMDRVRKRMAERLKRKTYSAQGKSKAQQDQEHGQDIRAARRCYSRTRGFTGGKTFRHIGRIPEEAMAHFRKHAGHKDPEMLKKFIKGQDFHVVPKGSF